MKEWLIRLTFILFGSFIVILALLTLEFGLSKFAPHHATLPTGYYEKDKYIGWKGIPGKETKWVEGRIFSYVKMNSHGFRDRERNYEKGKDIFRVVVLGDSYTAGLQVPLEQTFPYILEEKLNSEKSSKRLEVLNLGVAGFGTAQEYLTLKHYGLRYHPDLVILAFYINNDVLDNSLVLDSKLTGRNINDRIRPYFALNNGKLEELPFKIQASNPGNGEGEAKRDVAGQLQIKYLILKFSTKFFPNVFYSLEDRINGTTWLANFLWKSGIKKSKPESLDKFLIKFGVYAEEYTFEWQNAWEVTEALILKLAKELEVNKIRFLVVIIPKLDKLQPYRFELPRDGDKNPQQGVLRFDLKKPERILSNFLEANKIDYLLLRPEFEKYIKGTGKDLHFQYNYEDHWNANGHALAAQLIYKKLKDDKLVPMKGKDNCY
jgi:hypothetical protein